MAIAKKEAGKATEAKTAAPVPTEAVKAVEKKAAAPKAMAKKVEPKTKVVVEFAGKQIVMKDIISSATKAFTKANKGVVIKNMEIYVKPEEHVAYYVINGQGADEYKVNL